VAVGVASAMREEDVLLPSYRDNGALLWRGVKMEEILLYWGGDERGSRWSGPPHDFPFCVPVASQAPHAAGIAYAFKLRKQPRVAVCLFGDGATSKGDVWEAMNFAGVWKLPVVFLAAARAGDGPRLIEALTYRLGDHTTADDAARYRPPDDVQQHWKEEPIARLRAYLAGRKEWDKAREEALTRECQQQIDAAVEHYLATPPRAPETMFDHLYAELPAVYAGQRRELAGDADA
jgi:2-oxoisovalerate dehydrogenase E1 component alpha subunit